MKLGKHFIIDACLKTETFIKLSDTNYDIFKKLYSKDDKKDDKNIKNNYQSLLDI